MAVAEGGVWTHYFSCDIPWDFCKSEEFIQGMVWWKLICKIRIKFRQVTLDLSKGALFLKIFNICGGNGYLCPPSIGMGPQVKPPPGVTFQIFYLLMSTGRIFLLSILRHIFHYVLYSVVEIKVKIKLGKYYVYVNQRLVLFHAHFWVKCFP